MNRTEFIIATAVVLFLAFLLGWFLSWIVHRLTRASEGDISELDSMAQQLHEAEEMRDQAISYIEGREAELTRELKQCRAELAAAMDGLHAARQEASELRAYIDRARSKG